ncbi:hypothetical protein FKP32DRAFT_1592713, partial [Trametes sanguinea]
TSLAGAHCTRCGTPFLTTGAGSIRSIRKKRRQTSESPSGSDNVAVVRVLRRSCRACGFADDVPIDSANAPTFPKVRDRARRKSSAAPPAARAPGAAPVKPAAVPAPAQHAPVSQPHASRAAQSPATPASSRSSSIAPSSRPSPAPASAPASTGSSMKSSPTITSQPQIGSQVKSRPKKKTGLQSLLARNREKQEEEKKRAENQGQGGLSAFLQGL